METITPIELKARLEQGSSPLLIDVRESEEVAICKLPGAVHVPMGDIPSRLMDLDKHAGDEIIVYCHHGIRSANVQRFLLQHGFERVLNLTGGIDAYAVEADPAIARY